MSETREKRRGGRAARMANNKAMDNIQAPRFLSRNIPCYDLLCEEELVLIENHADWILQEVGIEFWGDDESISLFKEAGISVDGRRLRFDKGHIQSLCATAPKEYDMLARNPERSTTFGGNRLVFAPAYGSPFVYDLKGGRRQGTIKDFENFIKLTYMTPWLHHQSGTVCEPTDIPVNKRHLDMVYAHIKYSDKPFMGSVTAPERAQDSIEMAKIVFGEEVMEKHCVIQGNINVNSPLVYDEVMSGALKAYARANQGTVISPFILGGAMAPVTMPAAIAQAHAETLVGIALTQLVRKGAPVVYGNFLTTMDLKSGAPTFGTPESTLAGMAVGQLARRLGLPFRCGGHYTSSKVTDAQAMEESADSMLSGFLAGANFILQSAGWLEGGLVIGYEKFILDADHLGTLHTTAKGMVVDENTLGKSAFIENEPGQNFLGTEHTGQNFKTANYRSEMPDNNSFEQWTEDGSKDTAQRAYERWTKMLDEYQPPELDPAVDEALLDYMRVKKDSMEDEWY